MTLSQALGLSILAFAIMEYMVPYKKSWKTNKKQFMQLPFYLLLGMFLVPILGNVLSQLTLHNETFFTNMPFFPAFICAFLIGEFGYYWYHRLEHTNPFLWKFHMVHHHQSSVNLANFWFAHPFEIAVNYLAANLPLLLLGFKFGVMAAYLVTATILYMFSHLNVNIKIGYLKYIIGNPQLHRFHHSTDMKQAKNFCGRLPLWDIVFGTFYYQPDQDGPKEVGLAAEHAEHPTSILGGIFYPFRRLLKKNKQQIPD